MEVFLRVSFHWDLLQLINGLVLTDFNVRPDLGIFVSNEFFLLLRLCSAHVVPFRFHLSQRDHPQID